MALVIMRNFILPLVTHVLKFLIPNMEKLVVAFVGTNGLLSVQGQ